MNWKLKAKIFRALECTPFGSSLHYQLQRHVTREWPRRSDVLDALLTAARRVLAETRGCGESGLESAHFLEIGAGRDLAVAIALRLLGVGRVTCVDVSRLARLDLISHAAMYLAKRLEVPCPRFSSWMDLERFGIVYVAPADLGAADLAPLSFDAFYSVDTLEHIPAADLTNVLVASRRLLKSSGVMVHLIDYGDHYARGSGHLSCFNFLTYSEGAWRRFNSKFHYVNRLRHSQFVRMFNDVGMRIDRMEAVIEETQPLVLDKLAPEFSGFQVEDLFTVRAMIVSSAT
jgi:hypothetical protein